MPTNSIHTASGHVTKGFIGAVEDEWQMYSDRAEDYTIGLPVGFGASSIVYGATFHPASHLNTSSIPCALKVVDLDRLPPHTLHLLMQETRLMSLSKHPNVLRVRGSWMDGHKLFIALRLMNAGSAADVMQYAWPGGMEEEVVKCILKQALEGINYLHINGLIHRDVKAANLLIDEDGTVLLGDLGVAAPLWDAEDVPVQSKRSIITASSSRHGPHIYVSHGHGHGHGHGHSPHATHAHAHAHAHVHKHRALGKRKSFVGTPCWMAPEVITGKQYDASADIWSFGITAIELCAGRAPMSRSPPSAVLTHIATSTPPKLDRQNGVHTYSAAFADMVDMCLQKDPSKRPTAAQLLATPFFKSAKKKGYLVGTVLKGLPPLIKRQQRCRVPSVMTHATMDSWDFNISVREDTTSSHGMMSPTTSVYSFHSHHNRPRSTVPEGLLETEDDEDDGDEDEDESRGRGFVSPQEGEDAAAYARRIRTSRRSTSGSLSHSRLHSRNVSWAESMDEAFRHSVALDGPKHPDPIVEVDMLSSSPRSSEGLGAIRAAGAAVSKTPPEDKFLPGHMERLHTPSISPTPSHSESSHSSLSASNSNTTATSVADPVTPLSSNEPPPSVHLSSTGSSSSRLWRKLVGREKEKQKEAVSSIRDRAGRVSENGLAAFAAGSGVLSGVDSLRRKTLGSVLAGRASKVAQAGLARTVSRSGKPQ